MKNLGIVFAVLFIIAVIVFVPLGIIWSLNTLIPVMAIPYNFYSWLAVIILNLTWFGHAYAKSSD